MTRVRNRRGRQGWTKSCVFHASGPVCVKAALHPSPRWRLTSNLEPLCMPPSLQAAAALRLSAQILHALVPLTSCLKLPCMRVCLPSFLAGGPSHLLSEAPVYASLVTSLTGASSPAAQAQSRRRSVDTRPPSGRHHQPSAAANAAAAAAKALSRGQQQQPQPRTGASSSFSWDVNAPAFTPLTACREVAEPMAAGEANLAAAT